MLLFLWNFQKDVSLPDEYNIASGQFNRKKARISKKIRFFIPRKQKKTAFVPVFFPDQRNFMQFFRQKLPMKRVEPDFFRFLRSHLPHLKLRFIRQRRRLKPERIADFPPPLRPAEFRIPRQNLFSAPFFPVMLHPQTLQMHHFPEERLRLEAQNSAAVQPFDQFFSGSSQCSRSRRSFSSSLSFRRIP